MSVALTRAPVDVTPMKSAFGFDLAKSAHVVETVDAPGNENRAVRKQGRRAVVHARELRRLQTLARPARSGRLAWVVDGRHQDRVRAVTLLVLNPARRPAVASSALTDAVGKEERAVGTRLSVALPDDATHRCVNSPMMRPSGNASEAVQADCGPWYVKELQSVLAG